MGQNQRYRPDISNLWTFFSAMEISLRYSDFKEFCICGMLAICHLRLLQSEHDFKPGGGGGYSNYFLMGCAARGMKPLPISKDFLPQKTPDLNGTLF